MNRKVPLIVASFLLTCSAAALGDREAAQDSGAQALRDSAKFPWYDAEADQIKRVPLRPHVEPPQAFDWELSLQPRRSWSWAAIWDVVEMFMWALLVAILALGLYVLIRALSRRYLSEYGFQDDEFDDHRTEADRIENLPFQVKQPRTDLLAEARRQYQLGNYQEAIIYLFSYQLVRLDESHFIRLAKGKTNRQYLGEIRQQNGLRRLMTRTMLAFEDAFFGHHTIDKDRFETCWNELEEFHELVQPPA